MFTVESPIPDSHPPPYFHHSQESPAELDSHTKSESLVLAILHITRSIDRESCLAVGHRQWQFQGGTS